MSGELSTRLSLLVEQFKERQQAAYTSAYQAAEILHEIHRDKLYLESHSSFGAFCLEVFGISVATGKRMLTQVAENQIGPKPPGERGSQRAIRAGNESTPPISQRAAAQSAKDRKTSAVEATVVEEPASDGGEIVQSAQVHHQAPTVQVDDAPTIDPELVQLRATVAAQQSKLDEQSIEMEAMKLELEQPIQAPVVTAEGVSADFMAQLAQALEMSVDHPPATLLAKVKALMDERAKRKPAKKAEPKAKLASVTPIAGGDSVPGGPCKVHPKAKVRWAGVGKICDECHTIVKPNERIG